MKLNYTTHLICTPPLDGPATIESLLVSPGDHVEADMPLVRLHGNGIALEVCSPEAGTIGEFFVALQESVSSGDLLLAMEIEEQPFGFLPMEEETVFTPACQLTYPDRRTVVTRASVPLRVQPEAASLAARLGVDLAEVNPGTDGVVDDEAIATHVRDILIRWRKLRRLITD